MGNCFYRCNRSNDIQLHNRSRHAILKRHSEYRLVYDSHSRRNHSDASHSKQDIQTEELEVYYLHLCSPKGELNYAETNLQPTRKAV